ncbi:MAG: SWIM zinc finger family protein [Saprospiraceae bacterium]|nr:SWIM zinc finger family protein [Saprospiraceae bacterium]
MQLDLTSLEQTVPAAVLKNAAAFVHKNKVDELEESAPGHWIAFVRAEKDFDVQLHISGDTISQCSCDCGAETMPCAHAAAVLLVLRERLAGRPSVAKARKSKAAGAKKPAKKKKETFDDILQRVGHEELKAFLKEAFGRQRDFRNMFMARFSTPDEAQGSAEYTKLVKSILRSGVSRWGYFDGKGLRKITKPLNQLIRQAEIQLDKKQYLGVIQLVQVLVEEISEQLTKYYDNTGFLNGLIREGLGLFERIFESADAAQPLKNDLWEYLRQHCTLPKYTEQGEVYHKVMMQLLVRYAPAGDPEDQLHLLLDEQLLALRSNGNQAVLNDFRTKYWLSWKLALYQQLQRLPQAEALIDTHIEVPEFRRLKVQAAIDEDRWADARHLIEAGIEVARQKQHSGTVVQWKLLLLQMAQHLNDQAQVRSLGLDLFRSHSYQLQYYLAIKSTYTPEEWPPVAKGIIAELAKQKYMTPQLLPLLAEEQDWPALFAQISQAGEFELLLQYESALLEHFPEETQRLYISWLKTLAASSNTRSEYSQVAYLLEHLAQYPDAAAQTSELLTAFRTQYTRRKAMIEELAKVKIL